MFLHPDFANETNISYFHPLEVVDSGSGTQLHVELSGLNLANDPTSDPKTSHRNYFLSSNKNEI